MKKILMISALLIISGQVYSQCGVGEGEVTLVVQTDDYGYEGYWQIVPSGNACGTGTIDEGGNLTVGCSGAGAQQQDPGGYADNQTYNEGPWCLTLGNQYDLIYTDDWGDGGFHFEISVNGYQIESFEGIGLGGTFTFTVEEPPAYDLSVTGSNIYSYVTTGNYDIHAHIFNSGTTTITSYDLNYTVDNGPVQTHAVTGSSLANYQSEEIMHSIPLSIPVDGVYDIKIWADNINGGNPDGDNGNDTLFKQTEAGPGIPNYIDGYVSANWTNIVEIANSSDQVNTPTDLDFHPVLTNYELWVINKETESSGGSTVTIYNAGQQSQSSVYKQDGNAWHFMSLPTGMAFGLNGNWASSPGVYDANHNGGSAFTGPSLWSSDMSIYAQPSGGNGSHLDMLHLSPYSQGIASEVDNVYWVFDGYTNDIVRYDFAEDHGPGNSFHGDAIVWRYSDDAVQKDPNDQIVSHLVLDENKQWLYVVDHGNNRVIRIDITTGSDMGGTPNYPMNEPIAEYKEITGYTQETVVSTGLTKPAGIDVIGDRMVVSEYESGDIVIYDISTMPAIELERINTGLSSVQGLKIGPDGRIWFVDYNTNGVYRIDAENVSVEEEEIFLNVYPNPSNGNIQLSSSALGDGEIQVFDLQGKLVYTQMYTGNTTTSINMNVESGMYILKLQLNNGQSVTKKITIQ
ncbi:MAG: T9SS type A sorting domain-containing protein [Crocinitomicaceae bacterium]|nr:T9SS type A sorting domain-containing protein [Crocinitomicaceae bacterium]